MKPNSIRAAGMACILMTTSSIAGLVAPASVSSLKTTDTDSQGYIGLNWTLGQGWTPDVEVGLRRVKVQSDGDVQGGALTLSYRPGGGFDKIKLKAVKGDEDLQGELGFGYSLLQSSFLGTLGLQGNHITGGVDYMFNPGPQFYLGINTIGKYRRPTPGCPSGYTYNASTKQCDSAAPPPE